MYQTQAEVKVKDSQGKVIASQTYNKVVFDGLSADDKGKPTGGTDEELLASAIAFFQNEAGANGSGVREMLQNVTYSYDLGQRATIRQGLVTAAAGPEKAVEKGVKDLMAARAAAGKPLTIEQARAKFAAMMAE